MEKLQPNSPYQKRPAQVINLEKGKIPPQATDLEEVVLGAMMIDKKGVDEVIDILNPDVFTKRHTNTSLRLLIHCLWKASL